MQRWTAVISLSALIFASVFALPGAGEEAMVVVKNVVYGEGDGEPLTLDVYAPIEGTVHPAVIAVHGGGWHRGDKRQWEVVAPDLVEAGFVVFAVNYRLAETEDPTFVKAPQDIRAAIAWVRDDGDVFGADPASISLLGSSAGGHLALLAGQREGHAKIRSVATWSPAVNLKGLAKRGILLSAIRRFLGCPLQACSDRYKEMSPLHGVAASDPPTFLANSTDEVIPFFTVRRMARLLDPLGVEVSLKRVPGEAHGQRLGPLVLEDTIGFLLHHSASAPQ